MVAGQGRADGTPPATRAHHLVYYMSYGGGQRRLGPQPFFRLAPEGSSKFIASPDPRGPTALCPPLHLASLCGARV